MSRHLVRALVVLLTLSLLAVATVTTASAAERSLVPGSKLTSKPFRSIALVAVGDNVVCTGFVIGQRKVATAAHCLTRNASSGDYRLRQGLPGNVRVLRGYSRAAGGAPFAACGVSKVWAHKKFVRRNVRDRQFGSRAHDYAVLTTKSDCRFPRNAVMKLWATSPFDGQLRVGQKTRMAGYPADPRYSGTNGLNMWRTEGNLQPTGSDPRLINTTGFVAQGMSGAPVWRSFRRDSPCGQQHCVIAVLTECEVNSRGLCKTGDSTRRAVRITPAVKKLLRSR
jgi:V8-like Glu-specific endopeptidase